MKKVLIRNNKLISYVIGVALGDGNLSNPNKRATRLRVTCDKKYPIIYKEIKNSIQKILPDNKVTIVDRKDGAIDISCYSNKWESILGWKSHLGSKIKQKVRIPKWIFSKKEYIKECLKGLLQTDGSIYFDRNYKMVNFTANNRGLAYDVFRAIREIKYEPNIQKTQNKKTIKYVVRVTKKSSDFIREINLWKK